MEHDVVPLGERHAPHNFEYADETARLAATITDSKWVNALALQLDDGSYWRVASVSPATWEPVAVLDWDDLTGKPSTFPPSTHSHAISDVTDLQDELDAKEPSITKAIGYAKWTGSAWSFSNETYMQTSHAANAITGGEIANWNTAYGWGNHATAGYQAALGFTPENVANKSTDATADAASNTKYPSVKAIVDYAVSADASVLSSAATDATTKANAAQAAAIAASTPVSHLGSGGTAHANVVAAGAAGFMSGADKTKMDAITGANSGDETGDRIATLHHAASAKSALVDADEITGGDSATSFGLIRTTWTDVKAFLKTYFDTLYLGISATAANASQLLGSTWASPAAIGTTAPAAAKFTTLETTGNVGLGGAIVAGTRLQVGGTITGGGGYGRTVNAINTIASDNTVEHITYFSVPYTQAAAFTLPSLSHFKAILGDIGAGSAIGSQYGFLADSTLVGATKNYGFYSNIPTAAGRWNFYAAGDAPNRFVGETLVIGPTGLGYGTGAGGTATQATSRTTGVTLSKPTGKITLFSKTATTGTIASFILTNTLIAATDVVIVNFASATSADKYSLFVTAVDDGSCRIQVYNIAAVAVAEAPVINFAVIKGATA